MGIRLRYIENILAYLIIIPLLLLFLFPFLWLIITSVKEGTDAIAIPPIWDFHPTFNNYISLFRSTEGRSADFSGMLVSSVIVSVVTTILGLITGTMGAYAIARYKFKGKDFISTWTLSTLMVPAAVSLIPIFLLVGSLNLMDTYIALIIPYVAFNLPLIIWMIRGFILDVPVAIEEAAMVDGCSTFQILWKVVIPLILPGMAATSILALIQSWNEFLFALVLTRDMAKTAPIGIAEFITMYGIQWGEMTAASIVITSPIIIFTIFVRKYLVRGLTFGAVKG
ncbi:carbohydrate ABC transporter permease [Paenibacillus abyssi]|uniref:ABC transporter permease n=1 Tax=Paenibacillus abyssi TaxID=1340531 RepID=A0A917FT93_9BACL|nr:carbohydrate ABC transporter permease [Paenibacillus abyssi]GGG01254.1 ABC transporter permease [Paenibacillus abyssi]